MRKYIALVWLAVVYAANCCHADAASGILENSLVEGPSQAAMTIKEDGPQRTYELTTTAKLRDPDPPDKSVVIHEVPGCARIRTGSVFFDGLYALAVQEAMQDSVTQIKDGAYNHGDPIKLEAFQTGELWTYVWTRDLSYSTYLALAQFDPQRALNSLLFKTSVTKPSVIGGFTNQIVQDTGSGGSYPVSSDRVVWALGASQLLKFLPAPEQQEVLKQVYPILHDTLEQDRQLIYDPEDGLYRGEQSFLDWREQTYPGWTKTNVLAIAMSKALSVNAADYFALVIASEYAGKLGRHEDKVRYATWAKQLKAAINDHFFDPKAGLYSAYLLTDEANGIQVSRYDLLGESLAILTGVADQSRAKSILRRYPVGPYGPPVVWPEETTVPIYHNQAIWPFVTALWIEAARKAGDATVIDAGVHSLMRGAAFNLSNMENYDFTSGKTEVKNGVLSGPVVDSCRQIWSVAGYLAMVQDVVFGLETSSDGIRFLPCITGHLRNETFASSDVIELKNFSYRGRTISVRIHLPPVGFRGTGICPIRKTELNGKPVGTDFVAARSLQNHNEWDVYLEKSEENSDEESLHLVATGPDTSAIYGPVEPQWDDVGQGGITVLDGKLMLHYREADASNVVFNIYRDGRLCAKRLRETAWVDPDSSDYTNRVHFYAIETLDAKTGNVSHLTQSRFYADTNSQWEIVAKDMQNRGGQLVEGNHFENWGKPGDELTADFTARRSGHYLVRVKFSNGAGPVNTGITCAVKRLNICEAGSKDIVTMGYLLMPQSGDWRRFDWSSVVPAHLMAGEKYAVRIFEDPYSRNMSYLAGNERYTAWPGGGDDDYNYVNIAAIQLMQIRD
ncbi:MAG TPA: amylo-alpha-1,6-glucosidase [Pseudomonadales bacterium]|nr:amylo-alpha-1,6-glucosidase [Pseudomonadales bacterium]